MIKELIAAAAKQPDAFPLQTLAPGTIYYQNQRLRETPDIVIKMNDKSAVALMDYFVHVCVTYTNCVPSVARQCLDLLACELNSNFYNYSFWHYLELCKQTKYHYLDDYTRLVGVFGYGMKKHWVYGNDTNMMQATLDTARITIDNWLAFTNDEVRACSKVQGLSLEPRESSTSEKYVPYEMLVAAIKGPGSPTYKRWLLEYVPHYIRRDAYDMYREECAKHFVGKDARAREYWAEDFLDNVKDAEERERLIKKSGSFEVAHKDVGAEYAAALDRIRTLRAQATTPAAGLAYWHALKELDGHERTWSVANVHYTRELFLQLATNCNGALIKDVLKKEIGNTTNYTEKAVHVPSAAAMLLGMYLDAADVPWLIQYVNAARLLPRHMYDDDEYMVDITRMFVLHSIIDIAVKHKRRDAVQACADALRLVHDPRVRDSELEWLANQGIAPCAAPESAIQYCDQSKQDAIPTNEPHAVKQTKEDAPE
ncbi:MAG: hypothetical protein NTV22_00495 [bacterium]|nr:hypothetical protein [bacterium]